MECFFDLAESIDDYGHPAGFVGMLTANSFMKREFGKKLIEQCIARLDLTHVIDTSGAYIPGHGIPTVILLGRHQQPVQATIRTTMGIRGEPSTPDSPAKGLVWSAIVDQIDEPGSVSEYISVSDIERTRFARHPWSIGGGGAAELKEMLDSERDHALVSDIESIGFHAITGEDELFADWSRAEVERAGLSDVAERVFVPGDAVRDWSIFQGRLALFPYSGSGAFQPTDAFLRFAWGYRTGLEAGLMFGKTRSDRGMHWAEYVNLSVGRTRTPLSIAFASVTTTNHFVFDRGGKVFKQSAPVIKLPVDASIEDYLALVGLLNSSVACFWIHQVFHNKGASVDAKGARQTAVAWDNFYDIDGTKLQQFPIPAGRLPITLAQILDALAVDLAVHQASVICATATPTRERLDAARIESKRITAEMVTAQEELDWTCLNLYGLTTEPLTVPAVETAPPLSLGERAFEIVLARQVIAGEAEGTWFTRHRSTPITEFPPRWPGWYRELVQRRLDLIDRDSDVALVERPEHKRRWAREPWEKLEEAALREWLADRLEDRRLWFEGSGDAGRAVCRSVAQLADRVAVLDPDFFSVARLWRGVVEIDPVEVITALVTDEHVPAQAAARYKDSGLAKRRQWERTWDLQRIEDRGDPLPERLERIPVPPKYTQSDFLKSSYWKLRGKLDVPKERFVSVTAAERDADSTLVLAWAGFDHAQQAQAIGTLLVERQQLDGWDPDRLWPVVVALAELLPWLDQWHAEVDPRWGASPAHLYRDIANQYSMAGGRTLADAVRWQHAAHTRGRRRAGETQMQMTNEDDR